MKIAIIGMGKVGSTIAYSLLLRSIGDYFFLYDTYKDRLEGEISELTHASRILYPIRRKIIKEGSKENLKDCDLIIFTAGKPRKTSYEPEDINYEENRRVIIEYISEIKGKRVFLVTNPVKKLAAEFDFIPIGVGLDNARVETDSKTGGWIIDKKGYTNFGVAAEIVKMLLRGKHEVK